MKIVLSKNDYFLLKRKFFLEWEHSDINKRLIMASSMPRPLQKSFAHLIIRRKYLWSGLTEVFIDRVI